MSECARCGIDAEELLASLRKHVEGLDRALWDMELEESR